MMHQTVGLMDYIVP